MLSVHDECTTEAHLLFEGMILHIFRTFAFKKSAGTTAAILQEDKIKAEEVVF